MRILDNGIRFQAGEIQYFWFELLLNTGQRAFRAAAFHELSVLSLDKQEPEDWNMLGKQSAALRGLYNAQVDFIYSASGIFKPQRLGVVQYYGAAGTGDTREEAGELATNGLSAVLGVLNNHQQSQTRPPQKRWIEWYLEFITQRAQKLSAVLGHPDPRDSRRLQELDGSLPFDDGDLAAEQTAQLFRGMAGVGKDFVFQVTAEQINRAWFTEHLMRISRRLSTVASRQNGAISIGASISIPIMAALSNSVGASQARVESEAQSVADGDAHNWGRGEADGHAVTESESHTVGGSETHTVSKARTQSQAVSRGESQAVTEGESHAVTEGQSHSVTDGVANTVSSSQTTTQGQSTGQSQGQSTSHQQGGGYGYGTQEGQAQGQSETLSQGASHSQGYSGQAGIPGVGVGMNEGVSESYGLAQGESQVASQGQSQQWSESWGEAQGHQVGQSQGQSASQSQTTGQSTTTSHSETHGTSRSETHGQSRSETHGQSRTETHGQAVTRGESHSYSSMWSRTKGHAETQSHQESKQEGWGESHTEGRAQGVAASKGGMRALTRGLSTGMIPGINLGRSWQTEDAVAQRLTEVLSQVSSHFNLLSRNGGFLAEAVLFTEDGEGATTADSLIPQAFHGPNSPTPVLTVRDERLNTTLREHAASFLVHQEEDPNDPLMGAMGKRFSTYLTIEQLAAYTAPAIFQEGTLSVIPAIPRDGMAFYPDMEGDVLLGHQFSPETAQLTNAPVMLAKDRFIHLLFAGETGAGKTVAAERFAYEVARKWSDTRVVVLDFGAGWRKLLNAPGIEDQVDVRQLTPTGVRPLRWNPMQISRHITPQVQLASFVDIFGNLSQLGVKQQKHRFYETVEELYLEHGVLVNDPKVLNDGHWGKVVDATEASLSGGNIGQSLRELSREQVQKIAVHRSKKISLNAFHDKIEEKLQSLPRGDKIGRNIFNGIKFRVGALIRGATAAQFAAGEDALDVAELGTGEKKLLILEGGKELDQFSKAWLLSWAAWIMYQDMVKRRELQLISASEADLLMIFEEANIIFTGLDQKDSEQAGAVTAADQYNSMFRDSRKYGVRFAVITQSPSLIPAGVRSSCGSLFISKLSDPDDKDIVLSAMAKSEKGFRDEAWRRFLSDLGVGMTLGRLPYSMDRREMRPFLFRPLLLQAEEPTNAEIAQRLGRIDLRG